jgi:cobalt-precorrin-7 (C5)-methyltransferase
MAVSGKPILLVGCGPGAVEYLTDAARHAVAGAEVLIGAPRLLEMFPADDTTRIAVRGDTEATLAAIAEQRAAGRSIAVLTSGDPGLCSLATPILKRFGRAECTVIPGVSSVQVAFARLGLDWADARVLSAHGRAPTVAAETLSPFDKIAVLAGTPQATRWAAEAARALGDSHAAWLCENLTLADERIRRVTAEDLRAVVAASLAIVLLVRKSLLP